MVNKGLVNSRDRSLLRPGELARCNNCYYKPHDPALHKHPGRSAYSGTVAQAVLGLRYLEFDNLTAKLAKVRSTGSAGILSTSAFTAETGSWTDYSDSIGIPTGLDSVYYQDRHMLLIGAPTQTGDLIGNNLAYLSNGTVRRNGLAPVVSPPTVALTAPGSGAWPANDEFPLGWYFFITTETTDEAGDEAPFFLESAWEGMSMGAIRVTAANVGVIVTFPSLVNTGQYADVSLGLIQARRVYMAGPVGEIDPVPTSRPDNPPLSLFRLAGQTAVANTTLTVSASSLQAGALPGTGGGTFTNTANVVNDNNTGATGTSTQDLRAYNYGLASVGTITGIQIEIKMFANAISGFPFTAGLSKNSGAAVVGTAKSDSIDPSAGVYQLRTLGGPGDLWGTTWTTAEINAAAFGVKLIAGAGATSLNVDTIRVVVFDSNGTAFVLGQEFPFVAIPVGGGSTVLYPANSEPPVASTGDVFEGQVVTNDTNKPGEVAYSLPDRPEYFPKPYRMRIDPKHRDGVTCVRTLGEVLLIGMQKCLWRVNKLPREEDSFFETGRIKNMVSPDKGVVNTNAIATFSTPGQPILAAFVSLNGLHFTDGYNVDTLISGIDWYAMVNPDKLSSCWLVNYPKEHLLVFGYVPADDLSSTTPTKRLILHYHPSQTLEGGKLKVTGPIDLAASCAAPAFLSNKHIFLTGHSNGATYVEDRGWQDGGASNANLIMSVITRDQYGAGPGMQTTVERVWWRHHKYTSPEIILTVTPWVKNTGANYYTPAAGARWTGKARNADAGNNLTGDLSTLNNSGALERTDQHFLNESFCLQADTSSANNGYALSYFALDIAGKGFSEN